MNSIKDYFNRDISIIELDHLADDNPMSENAQWLLEQRYLATRYDSNINGLRKERNFAELVRRVSRVIASAETLYTDDVEWIRTLEKNIAADMLSKRFCFNSPCLFNAGAELITNSGPGVSANLIYKSSDEMTLDDYDLIYRHRQKSQQLFACFVIDVPDSIDGIFQSVKDAAIISKYGGGVGASFGHIRERGAKVHDGGNGGVASGPVSFMRTWDTMADVVVQGGRRRAALMGMLPIDHPDIEEFIDCKTEDGKLPYFNISVALTDAFMNKAKREDGLRIGECDKANALFDKLCKAAWQRGDPGVFFVDTANNDSLLENNPDYRIESTNPCGEQPLPNYTSCNLGSINVSKFTGVNNDGINWVNLDAQIMRSMYYLDLVIDASVYPLEKIEQRTKAIRPVGLGVMGLADLFIKTGTVYGSSESTRRAKFIAEQFAESSLIASILLGQEKGAFPESECLESISFDNMPVSYRNALACCSVELAQVEANSILRNSRRLSIAPTGSISMLFDTSPGIEPNFAWHWKRKVTTPDGGIEERDYWHPLLGDSQKHMVRIKKKITDSPFAEDQVFVAAHDVTPDQHVAMAGVFAPYIDSGISKTVNLPNSATVEDVKNIYLKAYELGLKGITVYRDGSRSTQPIITTESKQDEKPVITERPALVTGKTIKDVTPWGSIYMTLNVDSTNKPIEVFINVGKSGSELRSMNEALARVISIALQQGCALEDIIKTLKGLTGKEYWMLNAQSDNDAPVRSIPDAISALLDKLKNTILTGEFAENLQNENLKNQNVAVTPPASESSAVCPECNSPMERVNGCFYCFNCGYSPCK